VRSEGELLDPAFRDGLSSRSIRLQRHHAGSERRRLCCFAPIPNIVAYCCLRREKTESARRGGNSAFRGIQLATPGTTFNEAQKVSSGAHSLCPWERAGPTMAVQVEKVSGIDFKNAPRPIPCRNGPGCYAVSRQAQVSHLLPNLTRGPHQSLLLVFSVSTMSERAQRKYHAFRTPALARLSLPLHKRQILAIFCRLIL